jgi:hypothetical protein
VAQVFDLVGNVVSEGQGTRALATGESLPGHNRFPAQFD